MTRFASLFLLSCALCGQTFEVASVKPADPDTRGTSIHTANGAFTATGITARNCITMAYDVQTFQLEGGPGWMADQRFNIAAKLPAGSVKGPHDPEGMPKTREALRAMLADRFQLVVHRETKLMPAYVLVAAKGGPKLKETTDDGAGTNINSNSGKMSAERISMALFARNLAGTLGSPVVDMTGLKGVFNLTLEWTPDDVQSGAKPRAESSEPSAGPSIFTALQEQLGLKLDRQKAPVEMIVIDRIEKPTEN
jgi:uncharacterized protein (TIGR03435 family)